MEEQDNKIKERFQKDKLISKKADDLFNNFLKEEINMNNEETKNNKVKKFSTWKKILATAACFMVVLGGANIYASTQGYGNVFFLIKYLITGEKVEIADKDALLSDRDMVISYEPIQLTENIRIQIRRLQIKDNKATLSIVVREDENADSTVVPLGYTVYNGKGEKICEQKSKRTDGQKEYCDELELSSLYESDKVLNLEIMKNDGQKLVKLMIDIENKTITVEGAEEAISKISETDLKKFIGVVTKYPVLGEEQYDQIDNDMRITVAISLLNNYVSNKPNIEKVDGKNAYSVELIDEVLRELGYNNISSQYKKDMYAKVTNNGKTYFTSNYNEDDILLPSTCLEITNLTYSAGLYTVNYKYTPISENDTFDVTIEDLDIYNGSFMFRINDENKYSRYTIVQFEKEENEIEQNYQDLTEIDENNTNNTTTVVNTINTENVVNTDTTTTSNNNDTNSQNNKIDNYASSLNWVGHWAPGLQLQYPDIMTKTVIAEGYRGSDIEQPDQAAVIFEGDLVGKDPDTQKKITSHTKITVYLPEYVESMSEIDYYAHSVDVVFKHPVDFSVIPGGPAGLTSNKGINWSLHSEVKDGKKCELYTSYQSDVQFGYKILFETDNLENFKVINVINWFLGNAYYTSF